MVDSLIEKEKRINERGIRLSHLKRTLIEREENLESTLSNHMLECERLKDRERKLCKVEEEIENKRLSTSIREHDIELTARRLEERERRLLDILQLPVQGTSGCAPELAGTPVIDNGEVQKLVELGYKRLWVRIPSTPDTLLKGGHIRVVTDHSENSKLLNERRMRIEEQQHAFEKGLPIRPLW